MKNKSPNKKLIAKLAPPIIVKKQAAYVPLLQLGIVILLGIIIYSNSFDCSFHFDDIQSIVENSMIRELSDLKSWWDYSQTRLVAYYSFALNYHFHQLNVWGYHLVNVIIHLINACLVWWITIMIFSSAVMKDHPLSKYKNELAFFAALLFVSHPLATQSVTYIVQRLSSMAAMFYFFSIAFYLKARLIEKRNFSKTLFYVGAFVSALLSIGTKENAYTLPFAIILVEFYFFRTKNFTWNFKDYRPWLLIGGLIGFILMLALKFSFSIFKPIPSNEVHAGILTPVTYLLTQFNVVVKYIQLLIFPINQMVDYDMPVSTTFFEIGTILSFLFVSSLLFLAIYLYHKNRIISFGIIWFFLTLVIESSIIPINDLIFEHRTYLPSFGFFLILSAVVFILLREKSKLFAYSILALIIGFNSFATYQRNKVWKDELSLWSDNIQKAPNKPRPYYSRGVAYTTIDQWGKAIADFSKAIKLFPQYTFAYCNRGVAYGKLKDPDKAVADYNKALEIDPKYAAAYFNRGAYYGDLNQWAKAIADYTKAIEFNPKYTDAYSNRGIAYSRISEWDKAIADYTKAIEINPNYAKGFNNRGNTYVNLKDWDKALIDFSKAISLNPNYANAYNNRGAVYENKGMHEKAIADYSKAIEIDPNFTIAKNNREIAIKNLQNEKGIK